MVGGRCVPGGGHRLDDGHLRPVPGVGRRWGVAIAHDLLFPPPRAAIAEHGRPAFLRGLTVTTASLGNAGPVGAAALVLAPEAYAGRGVASLA
jgi:hypothetical protein